jgi:hypothetical protein
VPPYLSADEVAELAALLGDAPRRVGLVARVLDAAEQRRGVDLRLEEARSLVQRLRRLQDYPDEVEADRLRLAWSRLLLR